MDNSVGIGAAEGESACLSSQAMQGRPIGLGPNYWTCGPIDSLASIYLF